MRETNHIQPSLRTYDLTMIVMGLVIGMGIFSTPSEVAKHSGQQDIFFSAWIVGGIISMLGAMIFAEIGSRYPHAGGFYKLFSYCYHPAFAFMVNWITVISNAASTALVALMGATYLAPLICPELESGKTIISLFAVFLLFFINLAGIRMSSTLLNVLMFIKIALLAVIISSIFIAPAHSEVLYMQNKIPLFSSEWINAFTLCFIPVFFTYGGYQQTMNFGNDIKNAGNKFPRAILYGMIAVLVIYLLVNYAYANTLSFRELILTKTPASDITRILFGEQTHYIVSLIMFLSVMAYVNVSMMSNPRVYYAMAEDGVMPPIFMRVNSQTQVQKFALILFTSIILITLLFVGSFENLLKYVMFFDSIGFMAAAGSIFIFRKKNKQQGIHYSMPGYPLLPILFVTIYAVITITIFINSPSTAGIGFLLFCAGFPIYLLIQRIINNKKTIQQKN